MKVDSEVCDCITSETLDTGRTIDGTHFYNSYSKLQFALEPHYFRDGSLVIECKAIFRKSNVILKDTVTTNIKAGYGLRQYAFSTATETTGLYSSHIRLILFNLSLLTDRKSVV